MSAGPDLVPGELRGFRQFRLLGDGLHPVAHAGAGPWDGELEQARCGAGHDHPAPGRDCRCGLYAWYRPAGPDGSYGGVHAVISARGRTVLADRGFRTASARVVAVALPPAYRIRTGASEQARRVLAERYPHARVYASARRMWADHPPDDVSALGITGEPDAGRRWVAVAVACGRPSSCPATRCCCCPGATWRPLPGTGGRRSWCSSWPGRRRSS